MYRYRNSTCPCMHDRSNNSNLANNAIATPNNLESPCACGFNDPSLFPDNFMYGQSYVPIQYMDTTFKPDVGLKMGTIFPELVSPYEPCQGIAEIQYLREVTANEGRCPNAL